MERPEFLDVDMDQLARRLTFVAADRFDEIKVLHPAQSGGAELTVAGETPTRLTMCLPRTRWRRSATICSWTAAGVGRRSLCDRDERSRSPGGLSASNRINHLRAVWRADACGLCGGLRRLPAPHRQNHPLSTERR